MIEISINETPSKPCECCLFRIHMSLIYDCLTIFNFFRAWQCQQRCKNVFNRNRCADTTLGFALDVNESHALHCAFCIYVWNNIGMGNGYHRIMFEMRILMQSIFFYFFFFCKNNERKIKGRP